MTENSTSSQTEVAPVINKPEPAMFENFRSHEPSVKGPSLRERLMKLRDEMRRNQPEPVTNYGEAPNNESQIYNQLNRKWEDKHPLSGDTTPTALDQKLADTVKPVEMTKDGKSVFGADLYGSAPKLGADVVTGIDPTTGEATSTRNILAGDSEPTTLEQKVANYVDKNIAQPAAEPIRPLEEGTATWGKAPLTQERNFDDRKTGEPEKDEEGKLVKRNEMVGQRGYGLFERAKDRLKKIAKALTVSERLADLVDANQDGVVNIQDLKKLLKDT